jgi:hypothetical protein
MTFVFIKNFFSQPEYLWSERQTSVVYFSAKSSFFLFLLPSSFLTAVPMGLIHVTLGDERSGSAVRYSWRRVRTAVHNLAVGTVWLENTGHTQEQPVFFLFPLIN